MYTYTDSGVWYGSDYSSVMESFLCYSFKIWSLTFRLEHDGPDGSLPCWLRVRKFALGSLLVQPERVWFVPGICKHLAPVSQCLVPVRSLATEAAPRAEPSGWRPTGGYWRLLPDQRDSWINDLKRAGKCCGLLTRSLVEAWRTVGQTSKRCLQSLEA